MGNSSSSYEEDDDQNYKSSNNTSSNITSSNNISSNITRSNTNKVDTINPFSDVLNAKQLCLGPNLCIDSNTIQKIKNASINSSTMTISGGGNQDDEIAQGTIIDWNSYCGKPNGACDGSTYFKNKRGGGSGGFYWQEFNPNSSTDKKPTMFLDNTGNLRVYGNQLCIGPDDNKWCFTSNPNKQFLTISRNNAIDAPDQAIYHFSQDGNLWLNRSSKRGWVADNLASKK